MKRLLRSSALLLVVPLLATFAVAYHSLLWVISLVCGLAGLEIVWPPIPLADLEADASRAASPALSSPHSEIFR